jgi:hypothetical protein
MHYVILQNQMNIITFQFVFVFNFFEIEEVLLSLVKENADEYRKILREESGETLYMKVEYALRCKKEN